MEEVFEGFTISYYEYRHDNKFVVDRPATENEKPERIGMYQTLAQARTIIHKLIEKEELAKQNKLDIPCLIEKVADSGKVWESGKIIYCPNTYTIHVLVNGHKRQCDSTSVIQDTKENRERLAMMEELKKAWREVLDKKELLVNEAGELYNKFNALEYGLTKFDIKKLNPLLKE